MLKRLSEWLLDLFFPPKCAFCGRVLENNAGICKWCEKDLPYTVGTLQQQSFRSIEACVSPLYYDGRVRDSLLRFKFRGAHSYYRIYAQLMRKCIDENGISCDIITWVPLSRKRYRERGYNQSELIGRELGKIMDIPAVNLLKKTVHNKTQSGLNTAQERLNNVKGVYSLASVDVKDKSILIIDDIVTTGATLSECAGVLRRGGAKRVYASSVARKKT